MELAVHISKAGPSGRLTALPACGLLCAHTIDIIHVDGEYKARSGLAIGYFCRLNEFSRFCFFITAQTVMSLTTVQLGLFDPVADGLSRWLKLFC